MAELHDIEPIFAGLQRMRVDGGWLYMAITPYTNTPSLNGMVFVPDAPVATPEQLPRSGLTQKQIRARRKNAEKARDSLARAKSDKME